MKELHPLIQILMQFGFSILFLSWASIAIFGLAVGYPWSLFSVALIGFLVHNRDRSGKQ